MSQEIDYLILNKCCNFDWGAHDVGRFGIKGGNFRWYKGVRHEGTFLPVGLMWVYYNSFNWKLYSKLRIRELWVWNVYLC